MPPPPRKVDPNTRAAEDQLKLALGTRVRIIRKGTGGRIEIDFGNEDELQRLFEAADGATADSSPSSKSPDQVEISKSPNVQTLDRLLACAGCASKLAAGELAQVLGDIPRVDDDRVLVDFRTGDDAGVYRWAGGPALVQTVDFFTPIVDDPYVYGQIAAANALSDVYAMGGVPRTALAIAALPKDGPGPDVIRRSSAAATTRCAKPASRCSADTPSPIRKSSSATRSPARSIPIARADERARAGRRRTAPHQAARHRHHRDGRQAARRGRGSARRPRRRRCAG